MNLEAHAFQGAGGVMNSEGHEIMARHGLSQQEAVQNLEVTLNSPSSQA